MEESNPNIKESKLQEINRLIYITNISVLIILCLCVAAYFIVENNFKINNSVCLGISHNAKIFNQSFFGFLFLVHFLVIIIPQIYGFKENTWWKIYELIGFVVGILYLPVYFIYLIICETNI